MDETVSSFEDRVEQRCRAPANPDEGETTLQKSFLNFPKFLNPNLEESSEGGTHSVRCTGPRPGAPAFGTSGHAGQGQGRAHGRARLSAGPSPSKAKL